MHIKALKVFCDIVARRSFSKAARDNQMSQSGASQIVQQLEEHLGVKLIDRSKRPFVLTSAGRVYYEGVKRIVQRFYALEEEVRTLHEEVSGRVSVASIYSVGLSHLSQYVQRFLRRHPRSNVRVEYQHPHKVVEMVEQDRVDLGLVSYPRSTRVIKSVVLREEPMVLVCSPEHHLAKLDSVRFARLQGMELVSFDRDLRIRVELDRAFNTYHVEPIVVMEFDNIETIKRAVEINAGVSLLPEPSIRREVALGTLVGLPLDDVQLTRPIGMIYRRGKELGRSARLFMNMLRDESQREDSGGDSEHEIDESTTVAANSQPTSLSEWAETDREAKDRMAESGNLAHSSTDSMAADELTEGRSIMTSESSDEFY